MDYTERKNYLIQKALEYMNGAECVYLEDIKGNTDYVTLSYFGEPTQTEIVALEVVDGMKVYLWSYSEDYPDDGKSLDDLSYFSNDEIKKILDIFGIDY